MKLLVSFLGLVGLTVGLIIIDRTLESGLHSFYYVAAYLIFVMGTIIEQIVVSRKQKNVTS